MSEATSDAEVGESRTMVVADNITRTQIVMYAGASGDYNPLHSDEVYSTQVAAYPSVFAHGMLTMGATGRVLTDWFGAEALVRYGVRFVEQVWPGDTLTLPRRSPPCGRKGGVSWRISRCRPSTRTAFLWSPVVRPPGSAELSLTP